MRRNEGIFDLAAWGHGQNRPFRGPKMGQQWPFKHLEIPLESGREVSETRTIEGIFYLAAREVVLFEKFRKKYFAIFARKELT